MAGAGKSRIGKHLAQKRSLELVDVDFDLWEKMYGKPIQQILDEHDEDWYLKEEERLILDNTRGRDGLLISTAGSIAYLPEAKKHLRENSKVIYLTVPYEIIEERLRDKPPRAIIGLGRKTLRELYDERHPLYAEHAHKAVNVHGRELGEIISEIESYLDE